MRPGVRVLIAEDEALIAEELTERFQDLGFTVIAIVTSGELAIARSRELSPDLVIMDIRLKGAVDGIAAVAQIREYLDIPVIFLTAHSDDVTLARAKQTNPAGFLVKPVSERELRVTLELGLHKHAAEQRLRESEARFRALADDSPILIWATDGAGANEFVNRAYCEFFGVVPEQVQGLNWRSLIHPDDGEYIERFLAAVRDRVPFRAEARVRRADGEWRWLLSHGVPRSAPTGELLAMVGSSADITDRKLLDEQQRVAAIHAHYRSLFEHLPGTYVALTPGEFRIIAVTDAYIAVTHSSREALVGQRLFDVFEENLRHASADDVNAVKASLRRVADEGCVDALPVLSFPVRRDDGEFERCWWSIISAPVFGADGRVEYIIHRGEDVSEYVRQVGEVTAVPTGSDRMHRMAAEIVNRAASLQQANTDLRATQQQLRAEIAQRIALEDTRGHLLTQIVSAQEDERRRVSRELHDSLGQHLTALRVGLETLTRHQSEAAARESSLARLRELARTIDAEVERLAAELRPSALDDLGLADAIRRHVQQWTVDTGIPVDVHAGDIERASPAIETTVFRVVQEALTNVRKHARASRVSVVVDRHEDELFAIIDDDGIGFDPQTPTRRLGLSTMRERAILVGGSLQIESAPGGGTNVFLRTRHHG